jgi:hypothetical protein
MSEDQIESCLDAVAQAEKSLLEVKTILLKAKSGLGLQHARVETFDKSMPTFPDQYSELLQISDAGQSWHVKPRRFLSIEDFSEVLRIVKALSGRYVSAGRDSYFQVPKKTE